MDIERGVVVAKLDDPDMWGTITAIFPGQGILKIQSSPESQEKTGIPSFDVHVSLVGPHKEK